MGLLFRKHIEIMSYTIELVVLNMVGFFFHLFNWDDIKLNPPSRQYEFVQKN